MDDQRCACLLSNDIRQRAFGAVVRRGMFELSMMKMGSAIVDVPERDPICSKEHSPLAFFD